MQMLIVDMKYSLENNDKKKLSEHVQCRYKHHRYTFNIWFLDIISAGVADT